MQSGNINSRPTFLRNVILLVALLGVCFNSFAGNKDIEAYWAKSNPQNVKDFDHSAWNDLLSRYVVTNHPSGINRFRYGDVTSKDKAKLDKYIMSLAKEDPREYNRDAQKAYWLNLYNALTVQEVLQNYPLDSITSISGKGYMSKGPWNKKLVKVTGKALSLDDIENNILRPIWKDHRIHFGLSCASLGCPSILPVAFTAENTQELLVESGKDFVSHDRGVKVSKNEMKASMLFKWYRDDFAKDDKVLKKVLAHYAVDMKALYLLGYRGNITYSHDWRLNAP